MGSIASERPSVMNLKWSSDYYSSMRHRLSLMHARAITELLSLKKIIAHAHILIDSELGSDIIGAIYRTIGSVA